MPQDKDPKQILKRSLNRECRQLIMQANNVVEQIETAETVADFSMLRNTLAALSGDITRLTYLVATKEAQLDP